MSRAAPFPYTGREVAYAAAVQPVLIRLANPWRIATALAAAALVLFLGYASQVSDPGRSAVFERDPGIWPGVFHVHTTTSDGTGSVEDVVRAAKSAGATWVLVADHNRMDERRFRVIDDVLVVFAPEVGVPNGHVTALGVTRALTTPERRASDALATIRRLGGESIAAHPLGRKRPYTRLADPELIGLEVLSADAEFRDVVTQPHRFVPAMIAYLVNPMYGVRRLVRRPDATLATWDGLLATRRMAAFCAVDAHGTPAYDVLMRLLQMHVIVGAPRTGDAAADGQALVAALEGGRSYCGIEAFGPAGGFRFTATTTSGTTQMGGDVPLASSPVMRVDLLYSTWPGTVRPAMVCQGTSVPLEESPVTGGRRFEYRPASPAACRVEVEVGDSAGAAMPWIVSNPIYVK